MERRILQLLKGAFVKEIKGSLMFVTYGIIAHQVNVKGVMGAGSSLSLRNKWPVVYADYDLAYRRQELRLGEVIFTNIKIKDPTLQVASMCAQTDYGQTGIRYTSYKAFKRCLEKLKLWHVNSTKLKLPVFFPYEIGCGHAGGEWVIIKPLIKAYFPNAIIVKEG
jgi:hypothetical protein